MLRRALTGTLVLFIIAGTGSVGYTIDNDTEGTDKNSTKIEIKNQESSMEVVFPEDDFITSQETVLLSGRAEKGTTIMVEVYSVKELEETEIETHTLEVEELGIFNKSINLKKGTNKIVIKAKKEDTVVHSVTKKVIVADEEKAKEYLNKSEDINILNKLKKQISGDNSESKDIDEENNESKIIKEDNILNENIKEDNTESGEIKESDKLTE
ncbi:MAG: hypothetical protein FH753_06740 [Firmicutes bacterium]|nr:hypothetical protein [Bacillota bacterium]